MSLIPTWPFVAGALVIGAAGGAYVDHAVMSGRIDRLKTEHAEIERQRSEVYAADQVEERKREQGWAARVGRIEQEKIDEKARITARAAAELNSERMRLRAERKHSPTSGTGDAAPACQGTTGAELSRPDAEFLIRFASRADQQRAALAACYSAYDSLK